MDRGKASEHSYWTVDKTLKFRGVEGSGIPAQYSDASVEGRHSRSNLGRHVSQLLRSLQRDDTPGFDMQVHDHAISSVAADVGALELERKPRRV